MNIEAIAYMKSDFKTKFGIPKQAGLVPELKSTIVFEEKYRNRDALRKLEDFSRIWVIWGFSENIREEWSPTVRPPRLGGNERVGVFASRSPFRPNNLGLSCLEIESIDLDSDGGPYIKVLSADLMDGTPIYDIKPYMPYSDSFPDAKKGFARMADKNLEVVLPDKFNFPIEKLDALNAVLALDPRPAYQDDENRIYGFNFANYEIKFMVNNNKCIVKEIIANED